MLSLPNIIRSLFYLSFLISALGMGFATESVFAGKAGGDTNQSEIFAEPVSLLTEEEQNFLTAKKEITMCGSRLDAARRN